MRKQAIFLSLEKYCREMPKGAEGEGDKKYIFSLGKNTVQTDCQGGQIGLPAKGGRICGGANQRRIRGKPL